MLGISEVCENLYISGLETPNAILNKGIRSVINISSECPKLDLGPAIDYEKIHIADAPDTSIQIYFDRLADRIEDNLRQGKKTLVHCYVGRSRSASIILAYLMKYRDMSLRDAFFYLRSRRSIIGPNFGFIKQLIAYEKSLFGTTSVAFIDTAFGSVPDIYLSINRSSNLRRETTIPIEITRRTGTRPISYVERSTFSNDIPRINSSINRSSFLDDQQQQRQAARWNSTTSKPFESLREPFPTRRLTALRTGRYSPPFFTRYYLP